MVDTKCIILQYFLKIVHQIAYMVIWLQLAVKLTDVEKLPFLSSPNLHQYCNALINQALHICELGHEKMCLMSYANNKGADQPAHPRSLISAFVVRCLDSIISVDSITEI